MKFLRISKRWTKLRKIWNEDVKYTIKYLLRTKLDDKDHELLNSFYKKERARVIKLALNKTKRPTAICGRLSDGHEVETAMDDEVVNVN